MLDLLNRHRQVDVTDEAELTARGKHTAAHRQALAALSFAQYAQVGDAAEIALRNFIGAIVAAVFHHHNFGLIRLPGQERLNFLQSRRQAKFLVMHGNND